MIEVLVLISAVFLGIVFSRVTIEEKELWDFYLPKVGVVFFVLGVVLVFFDAVSAYTSFFVFLLCFFWWKADVFLGRSH